MLNIVVSGPGLIGRKHVQLLQSSKRSNIVAIVAPYSFENLKFSQSCQVPMVETIEEALDSFSIDAVIIASPNEFHCEQALLCLARKVPVLVEKPLAINSEQAYRIFQASEHFRTPVLVGHHRTHGAGLPMVKAFIDSSLFGRPVSFHGAALFYKPDDYFAEGAWRTRKGGGPILINMIHDVGIIQYLYGPIRSVWAYSSNVQRRFEVEDTAVFGFVFENGALGSFVLSDSAASNRSWEMTTGENPIYPHFSDVDCYHFSGSNGSLDFPTFRVRSYASDVKPSWWRGFESSRIEVQKMDPLEQQLRHFEDVVLGLASPLVSASVGLSNVRVIEAINQSLDSGCMVDVMR